MDLKTTNTRFMKKKAKLFEEYRHFSEGYNPYLIGSRWQVAQLNYEPAYEPNALHKLDVHRKTDEAFLLLEGLAVLVAAKINKKEVEFELSKMEPKVLYNILKGYWHNIALMEGAKVLIIEDANTHLPLPDVQDFLNTLPVCFGNTTFFGNFSPLAYGFLYLFDDLGCILQPKMSGKFQ